MGQNYLLGEKGIQINALMAATAWNMKKMMEKLKEKLLHFIFKLVVLDDVVKRRFDFFHFCGQHRMVYRAAVGTEKALLVRAHHLG